MAEIFGITFPLFGLIVLGFIAGKLRSISVDGLAWLNVFVIYLALPALFFQLLSKTPVEQLASGQFIATTTVATFVIFALSFAIGAFSSGGDISKSTIQGLAGAYGNIGYMGPGIAIAAFGPLAAVPVALIFSVENAMHFTISPLLMAIDKGHGVSRLRLLWTVFKNIITHPFIIATILGISAAVLKFHPPAPVDKLLELLMGAAAPCALFAMGVTIAIRPTGRFPAVIPVLISIKLLLHPLLVYVFLSIAGDFEPVWVYTAVLLAALPTATNVFVIAQQNGVWAERASSVILLSTGASIFTVTGLIYLINSGWLPVDLFPAG